MHGCQAAVDASACSLPAPRRSLSSCRCRGWSSEALAAAGKTQLPPAAPARPPDEPPLPPWLPGLVPRSLGCCRKRPANDSRGSAAGLLGRSRRVGRLNLLPPPTNPGSLNTLDRAANCVRIFGLCLGISLLASSFSFPPLLPGPLQFWSNRRWDHVVQHPVVGSVPGNIGSGRYQAR